MTTSGAPLQDVTRPVEGAPSGALDSALERRRFQLLSDSSAAASAIATRRNGSCLRTEASGGWISRRQQEGANHICKARGCVCSPPSRSQYAHEHQHRRLLAASANHEPNRLYYVCRKKSNSAPCLPREPRGFELVLPAEQLDPCYGCLHTFCLHSAHERARRRPAQEPPTRRQPFDLVRAKIIGPPLLAS